MLIRQLLMRLNIELPNNHDAPGAIMAHLQSLVPAATLSTALAELCHLSYLPIGQLTDQMLALHLLPEQWIRTYQILPFRNIHNQLSVVFANPDAMVLNFIHFWLAQPVCWYLVDHDKLAQRIAHLLHDQACQQLTQEDTVTRYVEQLFIDAMQKRASDIHIENFGDQVRIRLRIDGLLHEQAILPGEWSAKLLSHLKVQAQLDITERRLPQDGRLSVNLAQALDCRFNTCPMVNDHEKAVLRLLNNSGNKLTIDQLGFESAQRQLFINAIQQPQGMVLVTGPTGSGKTVTLYAALQWLNQTHVNISSVEEPVEIILKGINQVAINPKIGLTFATVLRALLRQDPDVIMVGEMRDVETTTIALQAAQTGHLVLSTLHTNSAVETLTRLQQMDIAAYQIAASVTLIVAQRLLRLLCQHCKIIDVCMTNHSSTPIYQAVGCEKCHQGYDGRMAIYECLPITPPIKQSILLNKSVTELQALQQQMAILSLKNHGWQKIYAGMTTPAELTRVLQTEQIYV